MKKIIFACITIITMMLFMAQPLFIKPLKANAATSLGITDDIDGYQWFLAFPDIKAHYGEDLYYAYVTLYDDSGEAETVCLIFDDCNIATDQGYTLQFTNAADIPLDVYIDKPTLNGGNAILLRRHRLSYGTVNYLEEFSDYNIEYFGFRYNTTGTNSNHQVICSGTRTLQNGSIENNSFNYHQDKVFKYNSSDSQNYRDRQTQFILPSELGLNLSVSFAYPFSGTMTRHTTGDNGLPTAADGNIMYVDNRRGDDAQFLMAIVPHGQTLSFNTWIYTGRDNIIGNPQYVYMCDEWQTFGALSAINIGDSTASANSIYAACAWHASPAGSSRSYSLMYESMDLKANTEYDVLVYACLNPDMEEMSGFYYDNNNLGGTYSVCGSLSDVQLVYSSTFSMTDPVKFNPDYKNVHDSSYAWNPNDTNAGLWENGSAYKDENGNVVIKGFKTGASTFSWENSGSGSGYGNISGGSGANINVQKSFGGFFGFFKGLLGLLPMEYNLLITFGLVGLVAIAIIKAVT